MTQKPPSNDSQKLRFVESLLDSLYENDREHAESLVTAGIDQIKNASVKKELASPTNSPRNRLPRWQAVCLATAALILIAIFLPFLFAPQSAVAAVRQSIQVALEDIGRHYSVTSKIRVGNVGSVTRNAELYVKGGKHFAIHANSPFPGQKIWLIGNQGKAWVVPPIGPVFEGDTKNLVTWMSRRDDLATPYLHISTILQRMQDSYDLKSLSDSKLETQQGEIVCRHIIGFLKDPDGIRMPDRMELWVDSKNGVAMRVVLEWKLEEGEFGHELIEIDFNSDIELTQAFFTPDNHGGANRPLIGFLANGNDQ